MLSNLLILNFFKSLLAVKRSSSAPSIELISASFPPAIIPCMIGFVLNVGGHSEASSTPSLHLFNT